jgi:predicted glycoside hydrolase/deacetylase ChbG (UPF0249 family)
VNICYDDYGLDRNVNAAIILLAQKQKLNSVSVLILSCSPLDIEQLKPFVGQLEVGLHLDIFKDKPVQNYLKCIFSASYLENEIKHQISLFNNQFNFVPKYYDGHMHCQIYPFIRSALIKILGSEKNSFYIRSCSIHSSIKSTLYVQFLRFLNMQFIKLIKKNGFKTNNFLFGAFNNHISIEDSFNSFILNANKDDIFFFHPSLTSTRIHEYEHIAKI